MNELRVRQIIKEELGNLLKSDRYIFERHLQILEGRNIQFGLETGTKIGTETTQKIGFFGVTPVIQQDAIADPSGGSTVDGQCRTVVSAILTNIENLGLFGNSD